jgi:sugar lactone lactonase YvrE
VTRPTTRRPTRLLALLAALTLLVPAPAGAAPAREKWDTRVFARVAAPGYPAYVLAHRNGRVYAGTYANPQGDQQRSRVREWSRSGTLLRSWTVPGQDLSQEHGVQVANQDAHGRLVLLERSTAAVMTLDVRTGRFRTWAHLPDLPTCAPGTTGPRCSPNAIDAPAIPNYATWGPGGALYVSDYGQAVIWRIPRGSVQPRVWFASPALDGSQFGTAGLAYRPGRRDLLVTQQSTATDGTVPTDGKLYRLPIRRSGEPGRLSTLWTSAPGDLPDGFGIARSGHLYVANAGLSNQLVELDADGHEIARFPSPPGPGENGSTVPFDTPSSATFLGRRVLVANQSFLGDASHHAILDVAVGERGRASYLPRRAYWR